MPLSWNLGTLTSWNPLGHSRSVTGLIYLYLYLKFLEPSGPVQACNGDCFIFFIYTRNAVQYKQAYSFTHDLDESNDQFCEVYLLGEENSTTEDSLSLCE